MFFKTKRPSSTHFYKREINIKFKVTFEYKNLNEAKQLGHKTSACKSGA